MARPGNLRDALEATRIVDSETGGTLNSGTKSAALSIFEGTKQRLGLLASTVSFGGGQDWSATLVEAGPARSFPIERSAGPAIAQRCMDAPRTQRAALGSLTCLPGAIRLASQMAGHCETVSCAQAA